MAEHQKSEVITKSKIDKAIELLKEQKPKERDDVSDREAVRKMRWYIEKLTSDKYGYTYDEVAEMLKGLGIHLSGSRIKYLIGELRKSSRRRQKTSLDDNNKSENLATETQPTVNASSEADKLRRNSEKGKRKNQQLTAQQQEDKSLSQNPTNRDAFVPKLYRDEDL
ncbi:hypothetical protein [Nostoc parmelioides]|uniref:Uncharacterized protein n=1 Tax=Nostoc parmelioides FACHB-3921 TaxID=2692909 RepID=A0ABR8BRF0_9NOSO|nr:hypothetical protein [Nostoc parmelioides]MBD2255401.1 hypothetical protein [Nostoc parmelioides FACHB-3921]